MNAMLAGILFVAAQHAALAEGFTEADLLFYGEVQQFSGVQATVLKTGELAMTFVNRGDASNTVTLSTRLRPTGVGESRPYSYAMRVPLKFLPDAREKTAYLAIGSQAADFHIQEITVDGRKATLRDGSTDFYTLSFASRASQNRLDLLVGAEDTDADGDQLPDWWETLHGLDSGNPNDAGEDGDGDGWSNLEEFQRGSDPTVSNRAPELATREIWVSELGEAGMYLHFLDSDTPPSGIALVVSGIDMQSSGFEFQFDGVSLHSGGSLTFRLTDVQSGRCTLVHRERGKREFALPIRWDAGGEVASGEINLRVVSAGATDGSEASVWLDGMDLGAAGSAIGHWPDRSGNQRHASQPLGDYQPVVSDHAASFAGSAAAHLFFDEAALPPGDHTVLAAYRTAVSSDAPQTLFALSRGYFQLAPTTQAIAYPGATLYQMDGVAVRGYANTAGTAVTSIFRREAAAGQGLNGISYDGESISATAMAPVLPALGARRRTDPGGASPVTEAFDGALHELLIFPMALPEQKLRDLHDYLESKWSRAVIWDLSHELKAVRLTLASNDDRYSIIRGGHGDDHLGGGSQNDILSGGPGADTLTGGEGSDQFVFGGIDTGPDVITDFDLENDVIDLTALFWDRKGDARDHLSVRLDASETATVTGFDSLLLIQRPDGSAQAIALRDTLVDEAQLVRLVMEDRLRMGGLSIPTDVQIALRSGGSATPIREGLDQALTVEVTREGAGVAAALDVPLGFFQDAQVRDFVTEGANGGTGHRAVVSFARGEKAKILTFRPLPDLETEGLESWELAVLPHHKYAISGDRIEQTIIDTPQVWLEIVEENAVAASGQAAMVRVHRDGDLSRSLVVDLRVGGTAREGMHIEQLPSRITIPAGLETTAVAITARPGALAGAPRAVLFQLGAKDHYQMGNPHDVVVYAADTLEAAANAGFDHWLQSTTDGEISGLADLLQDPESRERYLWAYATGERLAGALEKPEIAFGLVSYYPEIVVKGILPRADLRWGVETSADLNRWRDARDAFVERIDGGGLKLSGLLPYARLRQDFYRVTLVPDPGILTSERIADLVGTAQFGMDGKVRWAADPRTGDLVSGAFGVGERSRIVANARGPLTIAFEMEVTGGDPDGSDSLLFYVDGIAQAETNGAAVSFSKELTDARAHLLMWEFRSGGGQAVIRPFAP